LDRNRGHINLRSPIYATVLLFCIFLSARNWALADSCKGSGDWIDTDRPDQTNSSTVVPEGSLQMENGINWSVGQGSNVLDGSETSLRFGIHHCMELLLEAPNYVYSLNGPSASGFAEPVLSLKYQLGALPDRYQLSVTAGIGLPIGAKKVDNHGWNPNFQFPWQARLTDTWSIGGMFSVTWYTSDSSQNPTFEPTFVLQRAFDGLRGTAMLEYAGMYDHHQPIQILDAGGQFRPTVCQQIDFQTGFGLNRRSPDYFFGLGYSFRVDDIFP
jgi:hypothetical protein